MGIEMGDFFSDIGDNGVVEMYLKQVTNPLPERGLIIKGIELRPKDQE